MNEIHKSNDAGLDLFVPTGIGGRRRLVVGIDALLVARFTHRSVIYDESGEEERLLVPSGHGGS